MVDNINGMKYMGGGIKLRNVYILKKCTGMIKMSQVGCLMKHPTYGDNFCHWLFYKTGNCREASVTTVFKQRNCVYLLMYPALEHHSQKGHADTPKSAP